MPSCYNSGFGQYGPRSTSPQQHQSTMSSHYGIGSSTFGGQSAFGPPSFHSQFPRHTAPPAPPSMSGNNFNPSTGMADFGSNRYAPAYGNFPTIGHTATASTSTTSSSLAATPSPPPLVQNASAYFMDPSLQLAAASGTNGFCGIGTIVWLTNDRGLIEKIADGADGRGDPASDDGPKSPRGIPNDDNNNRNSELGGNSKAASPGAIGNLQVAFGIREFCDQNVTDLTTVLRIGYLVKFQVSTFNMSWLALCLYRSFFSGDVGHVRLPRQRYRWKTTAASLDRNIRFSTIFGRLVDRVANRNRSG